ncbi:hypothetical protein OsJ_00243 [Oryza sativa Japonica Group]|nr:hypothetical protein OsJ_00243 [Oryza sativa Japonica Group]
MAKAGARGAGQWWMKAAGMASAEGAKAAATDFATGSVSAAGGSRVRRGEEVVSSGDGGGWWRGLLCRRRGGRRHVEAVVRPRGWRGRRRVQASEAGSGACGSGRASWRPVAVWSSG